MNDDAEQTALRRMRELRELISKIQKLPRFTPAQLELLDTAAAKNSQVSEANVAGVLVPVIIRELIAKHGGIPKPVDPWNTDSAF